MTNFTIPKPRYAVLICEVASGITVRTEHEGEWDEGPEFGWTEGNYSCDCNRRLAWRQARGWTEEQIDAAEEADGDHCGEGAFTAVAILSDGTRVECQ